MSTATRWAIKRRLWGLASGIVAVALALRLINGPTVPPPLADEVFAAVEIHYFRLTGHHFAGATAGLLAHVIPVLDGRYLVSIFSAASVGDLRLISAAFGIATVCLLIPLGAELWSWSLGLLASATLAIMPWHIYFSRLYLPGSEYLFFTELSVLILLIGLRRGELRLLTGSAIAAAVTIYLYPVAIVATPLFVFGILAFRFDQVRRLGALRIFFPLALFIIALAPYAAGHFEAADPTVGNANSVLNVKMIWNHGMTPVDTVLGFLQNWAGYLRVQFFLLQGDPNPTHSIQVLGEVGWIAGLLGAAGILVGLVRRTRLQLLLLFWLAIYPVADALTYYDATANSLRGLSGSIVWAFWVAVGVLWLAEVVYARVRWMVMALVAASLVAQAFIFASLYLYPRTKPYDYLFETGWDRIYQAISHDGLKGVPITLHAGYQRDAMLQYFSKYQLRATRSILACYDLPFDVIHSTVVPRVFVIKDDPGFAEQPGCLHGDLTIRDKATLSRAAVEVGRQLDVVDEFSSDPSGRFHTAILLLHD